jgi:hypothetical protein
MNFITDLPLTNGNDSIFVVIDWLRKMAHFILCTKIVTRKETTKLLLNNIYRNHELSTNIVLDRGTQFTYNFWRGLLKLPGVKINLSTAYHLQTDGQTERVNKILE